MYGFALQIFVSFVNRVFRKALSTFLCLALIPQPNRQLDRPGLSRHADDASSHCFCVENSFLFFCLALFMSHFSLFQQVLPCWLPSNANVDAVNSSNISQVVAYVVTCCPAGTPRLAEKEVPTATRKHACAVI